MIKYDGLTKEQVLAGLYNASKPQGMGFLHYDPKNMTTEEAKELLEKTQYFDYLKGRVMKLNLSKEGEFSESGYDRDNGQGAAQKVINALISNNKTAIEKMHKVGLVNSAAVTQRQTETPTTTTEKDGMFVMTLGLDDCALELTKAISQAIDSHDWNSPE